MVDVGEDLALGLGQVGVPARGDDAEAEREENQDRFDRQDLSLLGGQAQPRTMIRPAPRADDRCSGAAAAGAGPGLPPEAIAPRV